VLKEELHHLNVQKFHLRNPLKLKISQLDLPKSSTVLSDAKLVRKMEITVSLVMITEKKHQNVNANQVILKMMKNVKNVTLNVPPVHLKINVECVLVIGKKNQIVLVQKDIMTMEKMLNVQNVNINVKNVKIHRTTVPNVTELEK
jgi:hypothetical protein